MAKRTEAYVDTSALIAFVDRSDSYHSLFRRLFSNPPALLITTLVVAEGHAWFLRRPFADQDLTLTDAVGLYIMKERRVSVCWSSDFHLGLTGVPLVIHGK